MIEIHCLCDISKMSAFAFPTNTITQYKVDTKNCKIHHQLIDYEKRAAVKEERRRIREAAQSLPNVKDVEKAIFSPQTLPPATK